jgi:molybdate transport system substrate-binding protein
MEVDGVDLVGPLPAEVQRVTVFTAAVAASSKSSGAARALIEFLTSPRGVEVMTKGGLDPIARR